MGAKNWNRRSTLSIGDYEALQWKSQIMLMWKMLPLHVTTMVIEESAQHNMPTAYADRERTVSTRAHMPLHIVNSAASASITILFLFYF